MDSLLFHPKVVHLPIALGVLMPLLAAGLALAWWRNWLPWRGWLVAVALQGVLVVSGVVALRTGEVDEERVERVVPEAAIEAHEEAAQVFVVGSGVVLALMVASASLATKRPGLPLAAVSTLGTLVVLGLGYRTGQAGGSLVYEQGVASAYTAAAASSAGSAPASAASAPASAAPAYEEEDDD